jgi:hypothetical protein
MTFILLNLRTMLCGPCLRFSNIRYWTHYIFENLSHGPHNAMVKLRNVMKQSFDSHKALTTNGFVFVCLHCDMFAFNLTFLCDGLPKRLPSLTPNFKVNNQQIFQHITHSGPLQIRASCKPFINQLSYGYSLGIQRIGFKLVSQCNTYSIL